ncbi:MAG: IPT/TIG domain-containing protein [Myxococcota bacterium]
MRRVCRLVLLMSLLSFGFGCGGEGGEMRILDVDPRNGPMQTQTPVIVTGQNFRTDIGYTVYFGTQRAPQVTVIDPETLRITTPQVDSGGTVDILIRPDIGTPYAIRGAYEYQDVGGNVVEQLGEGPARREGGSLAY